MVSKTRTAMALSLAAAAAGALGLWIWLHDSSTSEAACAPVQIVVGGYSRPAWPQRDGAASDGPTHDAARTAAEANTTVPMQASESSAQWRARFRLAMDGAPLSDLAVELRYYARSGRVAPWRGRSDAEGEVSIAGIDFDLTPAAELLVLPDARTAGLRAEIDLAPRSEPLEFDLQAPFQLRVRAEERGRSASGVEIALMSTETPDAQTRIDVQTTDAAGLAQFEWVYPHEELRVVARATHLVAVETALVRAPLSKDSEVRLQLAPAAVLEVCVRSEDGAPAGEMCVELRAASASEASDAGSGAAQPQGRRTQARTDSSGCARFDPAPSGCVLVAKAGCDGLFLATVEVPPLELGEVRQIQLRPGPKRGLLVQVEDERGSPVRGASVGVDLDVLGVTDGRGQFPIPMDAVRGRSLVWAHARGWSLGSTCAADLSTSEPGQLLRVELAREQSIAGEVVDARGRAVRHVTLRALPALDPACAHLALPLASLVNQRNARDGDPAERTDSAGEFRLGALRPGVHDLYVKPAKGPGFVVAGIRAGVEDLRIILPDAKSLAGPHIDVTVIDALTRAPIKGASATAWILDPGQDGQTTRKSSHDQENRATDKAGRASLRLPAPGWLRVSASADGYVSEKELDYAWFDAGAHRVELELQPAASLDVAVLDVSGAPVAGALIQVRDAKGTPLQLSFSFGEYCAHDVACPTDARGAAPRQKLAPGDMTVVLLTPDRSGVVAQQNVVLAPGGSHSVELRRP